jgi:hypothetical protein
LRILAVVLVAYGLLGVGIAFFGLVLTQDALTRMRAVDTQVGQTRGSARESLTTIARTLDGAAETTSGFAQSTREGSQALVTASGLAREAGQNLTGLTQITSITILGVQPFAGLDEPFRDTGRRLDQLGGELRVTGESLAENAIRVERLGEDLVTIRQQTLNVRESLDGALGAAMPGGLLDRTQLVIALILFWFALQGVLFIAAGLVTIFLVPSLVPAATPPGEMVEPSDGDRSSTHSSGIDRSSS